MHRITGSILLALLSSASPQTLQPLVAAPAQQVLDAAISITKQNALRRNDVPWDVVEPKVRALAAGAEKSADVYPAIRYLLTQLGDHHSFLMPPAQTNQFRTGGAQNPIPEVRVLPEGVGYVSVAVYQGNMRSNKFELQFANTSGGPWTSVFNGQSSGTTTQEEIYDFTDVSARFVRYLGHMNTVNSFNSVTEISVFAVP